MPEGLQQATAAVSGGLAVEWKRNVALAGAGAPPALARTFHCRHQLPTDCSCRRKEADPGEDYDGPPPYVDSYAGFEISGLEP
jgi:hypothetical protein